MSMLSVILPAYNEEVMIESAARTIEKILSDEKIEHEIIFVNDGSKDNTWQEMKRVAAETSGVRALCLSRNFGKECAIHAGLSASKGDCAAVLDCDLQHPPEKLVEMYRLWEEGYEIIEAKKSDRGKETAFHRGSSHMFYAIISRLTGMDLRDTSDFKLLDRKAVIAIINIKEKNTFFRALSGWVGFKTTSVEFEVRERTAGESKWSTWGLVKYALSNISAFSAAPMQMVTFMGVALLLVSIGISIDALISWIRGTALGGFTTVIMFQAFSSSIIMIGIGIVGFYISKIYEEINGRPKYIVSDEV